MFKMFGLIIIASLVASIYIDPIFGYNSACGFMVITGLFVGFMKV